MERRLMLSTTPLEASPAAVYDVVASTSFSSFQLPSESNHVVSPNGQDGFITIAGSPALISSDVSGVFVSFNSADVVIRGNVTQGVTVSDSWLSPGSLDTSAFDSDGVQTNAIQSTAFFNLDLNLRPILSEPLASPPHPGDGGMIAIRPLLEERKVEAPAKAISTEKVLSTSDSSQPASASPATLQGELARAAVFEVAGGEAGTHAIAPSKSKTTSSKADVEGLNLGRSAANEFRSEPMHGSSHASTAVPGRDAQPTAVSAAASSRQFADRGFMSAAEVLSVKESGAMTVDQTRSTAVVSVSQSMKAAKSLTRDHDARSNGANVGSIRLSHNGAAIVESSTKAGIWKRVLGATPLLALLVLERVAALHSRRASREVQAMAPARPGRRLSRKTINGSV